MFSCAGQRRKEKGTRKREGKGGGGGNGTPRRVNGIIRKFQGQLPSLIYCCCCCCCVWALDATASLPVESSLNGTKRNDRGTHVRRRTKEEFELVEGVFVLRKKEEKNEWGGGVEMIIYFLKVKGELPKKKKKKRVERTNASPLSLLLCCVCALMLAS